MKASDKGNENAAAGINIGALGLVIVGRVRATPWAITQIASTAFFSGAEHHGPAHTGVFSLGTVLSLVTLKGLLTDCLWVPLKASLTLLNSSNLSS